MRNQNCRIRAVTEITTESKIRFSIRKFVSAWKVYRRKPLTLDLHSVTCICKENKVKLSCNKVDIFVSMILTKM